MSNPQAPEWLKGEVRKLFEKRVEIYKKRGQSLIGMERSLAHYCRLEILLVSLWKKKASPSISLINAYRIYANEFFDTPASQLMRPKNKPPDNPFSKNAR